MMTAQGETQPPQYVDEAEALLQASFFYDDARTDALRNDFDTLTAEETGAREVVYAGALRVLAAARADERSMANVASREQTRAFNASWNLTPRKLTELASQYREPVGKMMRQLHIINNAERAIDESLGAEGYEFLYDRQKPYLRDIVRSLQAGPSTFRLGNGLSKRVGLPDKKYSLHGILVDAPTGSGKTAKMARAAVALGTGKVPLPNAKNSEHAKPVKILVVSPYQNLTAQLKGDVGNDTFQRLAPDVSISAYYGKEKDMSGDVVVTTIASFVEGFSDGQMAGTEFDAIFIDEAHHIVEPRMAQTLLQRCNIPVLGFTATTAYSNIRDAKLLLKRHIRHGDTLSYIDKGHLSPVRTYTGAVYPIDVNIALDDTLNSADLRLLRHRALGIVAADAASSFIAEGRQGLIFCEPGMQSSHAKLTRDLLLEKVLPDGRPITAGAMGNFQGGSNDSANQMMLREYNTGKLDVICTTDMGKEGLDLNEVSFIILAAKITSMLKLLQIVGRGLRPSSQFEDLILLQLAAVGFGQNHYYDKTFLEALGYADVVQGAGFRNRSSPPVARADKSAQSAQKTPPPFSNRLNDILQRTETRILGRVFLEPSATEKSVEIPADYRGLENIIAGKKVTPHHARYQLLRAGYEFVGRYEPQPDGTVQFVRYYEPAAASYFTDKPLPPKKGLVEGKDLLAWAAKDATVTTGDIATALGVSPKVLLRDYMTPDELTLGPVLRSGRLKGRAWSKEHGQQIIERLKRTLSIPPYFVIPKVAADQLNVQPNTLLELVRRLREELGVVDIVRGSRTLPGIPWSSLKQLEDRYGSRPGTKPIDYSRLPEYPGDKDPDRIAYARQLQRQWFDPSWVLTDGTEYLDDKPTTD